MTTPEEGQKMMDAWFEGLPSQINDHYSFLSENVGKFQTFDLLSYVSYYNHLHDSEEYKDYRVDKHFFISEVIALLCLKNNFVEESSVSEQDFLELADKIQETAIQYCIKKDGLDVKDISKNKDDIVKEVVYELKREGKVIRNPGHPEHHLLFSEQLYKPIENDLANLLGFNISDTIIIRRHLSKLINHKHRLALDTAKSKANIYSKEIILYKKKKVVSKNCHFDKDELEEYSQYTEKKIRTGMQNHFLNEMFYRYGNTYTFSAEELSDFADVDIDIVNSFLELFSCKFPSLKQTDEIYNSVTVLRRKPFIENGGRYLIPSIPLVIWAVEEVVESIIKQNKKLNKKYPNIKHDFSLNQGLSFLENLLPTASFAHSNLYYNYDGERCETDGLILYDKVLFIIEAKGQRITLKAKGGHELKTKDHLTDIIQDSYTQGIRTLKYIESNSIAVFSNNQNQEIAIKEGDYDDIIIVTLTLEPIGNISMLIKATNEIGYFNEGHFPWIISIYDLVAINDFIDNPILFIFYIKRRKKFLSYNLLSTYEELDLFSYFLLNGLNTDSVIKDAKEKNISWIQYAPDTDAINDYYMFKFGHKEKYTPKPKCFVPDNINRFLKQLDISKLPHRVRMALLLLEFNEKSINQLLDWIQKIKKEFKKDRGLHDCSIYTESAGGLGITFMTCKNKLELDYNLHRYCTYKLNQMNSNAWVGIGDMSIDSSKFDFKSMYLVIKKDLDVIQEIKV